MEGRAALGHAPWEDYEPAGSEVATWLRFDDPPIGDDGALDPLGGADARGPHARLGGRADRAHSRCPGSRRAPT